jgi:CopG family nickel-responsive transcriptional regulator
VRTVRACAEKLVALRGVRHGGVHVVPLDDGGDHPHQHGTGAPHVHRGPRA